MKKILSLILCLATVLGCISVALASGDTSIVKYEQNTSYTLSIPEIITLNDMGESNNDDYSVAVTNAVLQPGANVGVSIDYDGIVTTTTSDELTYSIYSVDGERVNSGSQILTVEAGNPDETYTYQFGAAATEKPKVAGHYEGTVVFVIDDQEYTMEEIEADDHLYAMGKTSPEYVVAKYNEDYTHVDIIKNGATSDGLMADFYVDSALDETKNREKSPTSDFNPVFATVESITVWPGVENIGAGAFVAENTQERATMEIDLGEVKTIGQYAFTYAPFATLEIPASVTDFSGASLFFAQKVKTLTFLSSSENQDRVLTIRDYLAVRTYLGLQNVIFPEDNVKIIFDVFSWLGADVSAVDDLCLPKTVSLVDSAPFKTERNVTLDTLTVDTEIIPDAFFGSCATTIRIGANVKKIGNRAFAESVTKLTGKIESVQVENGLQSIGDEAFANNPEISEVYIPESVVEIGANAFDQGVTIKGESGSYAETWATQNGYTFIAE